MEHGSDLAMVGLVVAMASLVTLGVRRSATRAGHAAPTRLASGVAAGLGLWLALTAALAHSGALAVWTARPPRWQLLPLSTFVVIVLLARSKTLPKLLAHTPPWWLVAAQTFRVGVELLIFEWFREGRAPVQVTFEGRNVDVLVGLSAPLVAWLLAGDRLKPALVVAWNLAGLAILAWTVGTVATSTPGPLHLDWPGQPFVALVTWPLVWLPALLAPLAVFMHVASILQTLHAAREARPAVTAA